MFVFHMYMEQAIMKAHQIRKIFVDRIYFIAKFCYNIINFSSLFLISLSSLHEVCIVYQVMNDNGRNQVRNYIVDLDIY